MLDRAVNGVYDFGGASPGRTSRSSVTLCWTRYCILQYASWFAPRLELTYTPVIVTSVSWAITRLLDTGRG